MYWTPLLIVAALAAGPQVKVSTLDGGSHQGTLAALSAEELKLHKDGEELALPTANLLGVRFTENDGIPPGEEKTAEVVLVDGSSMECTTVATSGRQMALAGPLLGEFRVPLSQVASVRFDRDPVVDDNWQKLVDRELKRDLLVIKKKGEVVVLDFLDGTVAGIDEQKVAFVLDGNEIPVGREKVFGIIYARAPAEDRKPVCQVRLAGNRRLSLSRVVYGGQKLTATLLAGAEVQLPLEAVRELDFSLGKVRYLSDMEPRQVKYTPFFGDDEDSLWVIELRRDKNQESGPLKVGRQTYDRGLWIHSRTFLRYHLGGDYRRLKAVMGIDGLVAGKGQGHVHVTISGDEKTLFEGDVADGDEPRDLDLDVSGVRFLEILVDYGENLDICDHLVLADARVLK